MDYDYDEADRYEGRILWGRIAVYGVAFVIVFILGTWWGGRGEPDEERIVELQTEVARLEEQNRELQSTIDTLSAGEQAEPEEATEEDDEEAEEPEESPEEDNAEEPETRTYLVQPGDTLRGIANEVYGDPDQWEVIAEANGLTRETVLTVGQELVIPPLDDGGDA
jgi:LysM repeat protein